MRHYVYGFRGTDEFFGMFSWNADVILEVAARRLEGWKVYHREAPCASR